jgi:K+-sensing histidine kinase KdpD
VHLVAELLDNAAAYSPPMAAIILTGAPDGDGYRIEVGDRGLGMSDEELAWANRVLAGRPPTADPPAGDRLGLVVAGRLAARHGMAVHLARSPAGGVTATVDLPPALLAPRSPARAQRP